MTQQSRPASPRSLAPNEEPEIGFEESIPSDGDDPVGEKMIEDLGQARPEQKPEEPPPEPMPEQLPVS